MGTVYDKDVVLWAQEQARLLRSGQFSQLDIEHLADEIEDVGKSEHRELASRMTVLLAHLMKWQYQPGCRSKSWQRTIKVQRDGLARRLEKTPSLKASIREAEWLAEAWSDALAIAIEETGLDAFPDDCPWTADRILEATFWPGEG